MPRRILRHDQAQSDLIEAAAYIAENSPSAAYRFLTAAEKAFLHLAEMPGMGVLHDYQRPELRGMHMWPVPGFRNILIFYAATQDTIEIIRVLHGARDIESLFIPGER